MKKNYFQQERKQNLIILNIMKASLHGQFKAQEGNILVKRVRIILALLAVVVCSLNVRTTTIDTLRHSRNLHRVLNRALLEHDDLDIYWFGYRTGQYLINYPIHEYYFVDEVSQFLQRVQKVFGNVETFIFGNMNQKEFNKTSQKIVVYDDEGVIRLYNWTVSEGIKQPFTSEDTTQLKKKLISSRSIDIQINGLKSSFLEKGKENTQEWDVTLVIQPFSQTSVFVTVVLQQKIFLGYNHLLHIVLGIGTILLFVSEIRSRQSKSKFIKKTFVQKIEPSDIPDFLVGFFLIYSSFASLLDLYTVRYIVLLDGVTCFVSWLYILKLYTENDDYHISFLIKKSYIFVGRLFISFGPMFIGFCLFALTAFCRYTNLFVSFHKAFISLFCVCYYNMTYEEYRTTERTNPISSIFFTVLIMLFTICIYSGMLVSVFCSYMWNKRENKNKQELMESLKIECFSCKSKYNYSQGYQASMEISIKKKQTQLLQTDDDQVSNKYRNVLKQKIKFLEEESIQLLEENFNIMYENDNANEVYKYEAQMNKWRGKVKELIKQCSLQI